MPKLNENQITAINHTNGPMLVLSGPGSGKTTVITQRLLNLTKNNVSPGDILTVTFTKAAAIEMESRYKLAGGKPGAVFSTFHALFFRILREHLGYGLGSIISETDKRKYLFDAVEGYGLETDDIDQTVDTFLLNYGLIKNDLQPPEIFKPREMSKEEFWALFKIYEAHKERNELIDFDDMMSNCYYLFVNDKTALDRWRKKYKYIQIDEFQDINRAQYECVKMLAYPHNNIFAVGDDDQSIYSFRGARPEFMKSFAREMKGCQQTCLDTNYRSTDQIITVSERLIAKNKNRFEKTITGTGRTGALPAFFFAKNSEEEADRIVEMITRLHEKVPYKDMAVIYRNNLSGNPYARRLVNRGIPYFLKDNTYNVYDHWIARDICAYVDFIYNTSDDAAFERIVNKPMRYVGKSVIETAKRMGMSTFYGVMNADNLSKKGRRELELLYNSIQQARRLNGRQLALYIYRALEYGRYLSDYAAYKKCSHVFLEQIAEEIISIAGELDDLRGLKNLLADYKYKTAASPRQGDDAVTLTTIHSAKGLEFGTVFIPSLVETMLPHGTPSHDWEVEEERRLFYVAVTRTKNRLIMSAFGKNSIQSGAELSRFAGDIGIKKKDK